jgi:heme-degrading monooxygenase HmoA
MMLEHALLAVTPGQESAFEASVVEAFPIIESAEGCFGAEVRRQAEDESIYLLLVRWDSIEAHLAFRETELFAGWRALTHHFYREPPSVTHFHEPLAR